ncbi:MAG: hypothetical protein WAW39_19765 [Prosthecobacter sp.]|uniref:hypothetical protein n=1 Tax=Prosthecobacter sp. TaxID=1965333 RepID=UPI003BAFAB34
MSSSSRSGCLLTLLQLFAVYLLSHGPVMALYSSQRIHGDVPAAVTTIYQPLTWLYEHTPLGTPMTAYDAWWKNLLKKS